MNAHLLRHKLTPAEYLDITREIVTPRPTFTDYWDNIPEYLIARCPLCGATYTGQLDTYSLQHWVGPEHGKRVFTQFAETIGCQHFVRTHPFINLNGLLPSELVRQKTLGSEVPYIHPFWLPDDVKSYAVIHALPICRVEEERFVPRYSLYMLTYYSEDPAEMLNQRWKAAQAWGTLLAPGYLIDQEEIFDLLRWVRMGKLRWLARRDPGLPLQMGPAEAFPYAGIQGYKTQRIFYTDGQVGTYPALDKILVMTICLDEGTSYELKEILHTIGTDVVTGLIWGGSNLDWLGTEDASQFNAQVDTAPNRRMLIPGERLLKLSEQVWQTIEGEFVGYRVATDARKFLETGAPLTQFERSSAEMAIRFSDGYYVDVYLRCQTYADRLAGHFRSVEWQDPARFTIQENK